MGQTFFEGNGILRCYDMYPTQFGKIPHMTAYLSTLKSLGFNALWINPMQIQGEVKDFIKRDKNNGVRSGNEVTRSLYAMHDPDMISPYFSVAPRDEDGNLTVSIEQAKALDTIALKEFTDTARKHGIVPMFDLVLNHVASSAPIVKQKPHWFKSIDPIFIDACKFNYDDEETRTEIIEQFWKPFINRYMKDYGFDGVRVDAVGHLPFELRNAIYTYINVLAKELGKPKPIILDEALFSMRPLKEEVAHLQLPARGPTHIMTESYKAKRQKNGSLPSWVKEEEQEKARVVFECRGGRTRRNVKGGCVNFTGNHDFNSLAMTVFYEIAEERLSQNPALNNLKKSFDNQFGEDDSRKRILLYSYVKELESELKTDPDLKQDLTLRMREKMAISALGSSGGWFILSGDETGDLLAKFVFHRANALNQDYYPQQIHKAFLDDRIDACNAILEELAKTIIQNDRTNHVAEIYAELKKDPSNQKRLLAAYIENLKNQINSADTKICEQFRKAAAIRKLKIQFTKNDYEPRVRNGENGWNGCCDLKDFTRQINNILKQLPASQPGFWSEAIQLKDKPTLFIVIRKNGNGLDSQTDLAIINLGDSPLTFTNDDLDQVAKEFQKRVVPENERKEGNPVYDKAYACVMNCTAKNIFADPCITLESHRQPTPLRFSAKEKRVFHPIGKEYKKGQKFKI